MTNLEKLNELSEIARSAQKYIHDLEVQFTQTPGDYDLSPTIEQAKRSFIAKQTEYSKLLSEIKDNKNAGMEYTESIAFSLN